MNRLLAPLLLALALLAPMRAGAENPDWIEIKNGAPLTLKPDRAYILYRTVKMDGVIGADLVFMRDPESDEQAAYRSAWQAAFAKAKAKRDRERASALAANASGKGSKVTVPPVLTPRDFLFRYDGPPNLMRVHSGNQYLETPGENVYLIEARPGSYLVAGQAFKLFVNTQTCMCMGTVRFPARAGMITDLGHVLIDDVASVSPLPELAPFTGRGARINGAILLMVSTVRPYAEGDSVPELLRALPRVPAELRAVGKFPNRFAASVNRMAPIPGVLAYDEDRVIDLKAGRP